MSVTEERTSRDMKSWFQSRWWLAFTLTEREEEAGREEYGPLPLQSVRRLASPWP